MCEGIFVANPEARQLTRAIHLQGQPVGIIVRFSNASGNPEVPDGDQNGRGMIVAFQLPDGGATDIVAQSTMGFVARTPEEFLEFLKASPADARSGSHGHVEDFLAGHPHSRGFVERLTSEPVPVSYTSIPYYAVNAFRFSNAEGESRFGRYRVIPEAPVAFLPV